jgi:Spy/CpxP family protein refolding chaperone
MKKLMMGVLTGFLFLIAASQVSYADQCGCSGPMGRGGMEFGRSMPPRMMHHKEGSMYGSPEAAHFMWKKLMGLGLSEKQIDDLKAIRTRVEKDAIKKRAELQLARVDLREFLHKDQVDMKAVEASLKKVESVRTDLKLAHIKAREEMKAILTPEQRKKLKEDIKAGFMMHEGKCGEWHGKHEFMPPVQKDEAQHGAEAK